MKMYYVCYIRNCSFTITHHLIHLFQLNVLFTSNFTYNFVSVTCPIPALHGMYLLFPNVLCTSLSNGCHINSDTIVMCALY